MIRWTVRSVNLIGLILGHVSGKWRGGYWIPPPTHTLLNMEVTEGLQSSYWKIWKHCHWLSGLDDLFLSFIWFTCNKEANMMNQTSILKQVNKEQSLSLFPQVIHHFSPLGKTSLVKLVFVVNSGHAKSTNVQVTVQALTLLCCTIIHTRPLNKIMWKNTQKHRMNYSMRLANVMSP